MIDDEDFPDMDDRDIEQDDREQRHKLMTTWTREKAELNSNTEYK